MKVTVTRYLNVRVGKASVNAPSYQYLAPGTILEVEDKIYKGDKYEDRDDWLKDAAGNYYWIGGVSTKATPSSELSGENVQLDLSHANWSIKDYDIETIWTYSKGEDVKIAIIDTGLNKNHSNIVKKTNIEFYNIFNQSHLPEDCMDYEGHGTHCAGIIAAHGPNVYGLAPASTLLIIKATINGTLECKDLALAINQAVKLGADIISVSYEFYGSDPDFELLKTAVLDANNSNALIVACTGNGGNAQVLAETYPASFPTSIGVGASDENRKFWEKTTVNTNIDILAPGCNIELIGTNNETTLIDSGTSYSTPYIAGVCALLMSYSKKKDLDLIRNTLKLKSSDKEAIQTQIQQYYSDPDLQISNLGIVNPFDTFNSFK